MDDDSIACGGCYIGRCRHLYSLLLLAFLLILCSTHDRFLAAQGRPFSKPEPGRSQSQTSGAISAEKVPMARAMIGSRPPRCERRCTARCGHCEAVQVPQERATASGRQYYAAVFAAGVIDGDRGGSNYKPVSWKCKCGDVIVNP